MGYHVGQYNWKKRNDYLYLQAHHCTTPPPLTGGTVYPQIAVEQSESYSDWNGTPLKKITKDWLDQFNMTLDQTTITATGGGGISSKKIYTYVTNNGFFREPQETDEYDFGATSAARMTVTNYQSFSGANGTIAAAPCQVLICSAGTSCTSTSANKVSETDYFYDGGTAICGISGSAATTAVSGLVSGTHDETLYAPGSTTPRANVTKGIRWLNGGTSPATTYAYDKTSHVTSATDSCGNTACSDMTGSNHTTTYSYTDAYTALSDGSNIAYTPPNDATNALLTRITDPLGHIQNFTYDYTTGELTSATDVNGRVSSYVYNDPFARPTLATFPDGGQTSIAYNDSTYNASANTPSVTTTKKITSTLNQVNIAATDGMGHIVRTILNSDPEGADTTDTTYDGFGRVLTQSNPHRAGFSTTDGTTTYTYDALGRTTLVTKSDSSTVSTSYDQASGNTICTTVTDESGKSRKSCSDGFGRLVKVLEDPGASPHFNYETDYAYDVLGNLTCAVQKGTDATLFSTCAAAPAAWRPRSFVYDSLSRLTSATNPESGTTTYTYDANGNLATKTAPVSNQTGTATVTTTYTYDALNRLTGKSYSDGTTPAAFFAYDAPSQWGVTLTNTKGRLYEK